jgi:hypothetical protein
MCGVPSLKKLKRRWRTMVTHKKAVPLFSEFYQTRFMRAGLIRVPAHKYKAEKNIKGVHEGIGSESHYWTAQNILTGNEPSVLVLMKICHS